MWLKVVTSTAVVLGGVSAVHAAEGCTPAQFDALQKSEHIVASLRPDKPGQARVFAIDGTEFTAGQSLWMRGQLNKSSRACVRGEGSTAAVLLTELQQFIQSHVRS